MHLPQEREMQQKQEVCVPSLPIGTLRYFYDFRDESPKATGRALYARTAVRKFFFLKKKPTTVGRQSAVQQPRAAANRSCLICLTRPSTAHVFACRASASMTKRSQAENPSQSPLPLMKRARLRACSQRKG